MENNEMNSKFLPIAVVLAGLFIAGAVMWNGSHPASAPAGTGNTVVAPKVDIKDVKTDGNPFIGKVDAPVTIAFWSDFQCPFCRAVEIGGIPQIPTPPALPEVIKNYVDTGKVKIVFMDFTFLGNDSVAAALYSRSVWKLYPDQYLKWREAMLKAQDEEGDKGFGNAKTIDALNATIAGLDASRIITDVQANTDSYKTMIDRDRVEAGRVGIQATPSFVIGKQVIAGAYPYEAFEKAINEILK